VWWANLVERLSAKEFFVYIKPAKDRLELNLFEAKTLAEVSEGTGPFQFSEDVYLLKFSSHTGASLFINRVCGSKEAGYFVGIVEELSEAELATRLKEFIGSASYKVVCSPFDKSLISKIVASLGGKVSVRSPQKVIRLLKTEKGWLVGVIFTQSARTRLSSNPPKNWAYFHPGVLEPILSGIMCNLSGVGNDGIILDPFCGSGSTLIAAHVLGIKAVGVDLSKKQVYGCRRNTKQLELVLGVLRADAMNLPFKRFTFDAAVFDPPYGRVSSLFKRKFEELMHKTFENLKRVLKQRSSLCFLYPEGKGVEELINAWDFKVCYTYRIPVHRNLVRVLTVCKV